MFPYVKVNIKLWSLCKSSSVWSLCRSPYGYSCQVLKSLIHNTVMYMYLHSYKINILICNSKIYWISKETIIHNSETVMLNTQVIASVTLLSKCYILGREKRGIENTRTWNWRTRCTALCTLHIELYVCFIACYYELLMLILYEL